MVCLGKSVQYSNLNSILAALKFKVLKCSIETHPPFVEELTKIIVKKVSKFKAIGRRFNVLHPFGRFSGLERLCD